MNNIQVGDLVKVINKYSICYGETYTVKSVEDDGITVCYWLDGITTESFINSFRCVELELIGSPVNPLNPPQVWNSAVYDWLKK